MDIIFAVIMLQELGRKARTSLLLSFIDLQKACDSADRTLSHSLGSFADNNRIELARGMIMVYARSGLRLHRDCQ